MPFSVMKMSLFYSVIVSVLESDGYTYIASRKDNGY